MKDASLIGLITGLRMAAVVIYLLMLAEFLLRWRDVGGSATANRRAAGRWWRLERIMTAIAVAGFFSPEFIMRMNGVGPATLHLGMHLVGVALIVAAGVVGLVAFDVGQGRRPSSIWAYAGIPLIFAGWGMVAHV